MKKKCILSFFFSMFFILMMANPALTQEEFTGVIVGGGEWDAFFDPAVGGNTAMSVRVNFPGNASGGHIHMTVNNGDYLLVEVDPEYSTILDGDWHVHPDSNVGIVTGYAFWGIGQIVDTNIESILNSWCVLGGYDGSESDYLFGWWDEEIPFVRSYAIGVYRFVLMYGNQLLPLWTVMDKGNITINVMAEEP